MYRAHVLVVFTCLAALTSSSQTIPEDLAARGRHALEAGQYVQAAQAYEELSRLQPTVAELHVTLGVIYFKQGEFSRSAAEYRQAQRMKPGFPHIDSLLAMALSEQGEYERAMAGLEKGFHQTADLELRRMCGLRLERAYISMHKGRSALQVAVELQQAYPRDPEVLYYASKVFGNEAYLAAQQLFQVAPDSLWGRMAMGEAHESQGDVDEAIKDYEAVLELDPNRANVHFRIGRALLTRGEAKGKSDDLESAAAQFQMELTVDPTNANAAYELAEGFRKRGRLDDAGRYFEQAIASYPSFEEAHVGLAATMLGHDDVQGALTQLQKAVALQPDDAVAWYRLSQVQRRLGNAAAQQHALAEFSRLRTAQPRTPSDAGVTPQTIEPSEKQQ